MTGTSTAGTRLCRRGATGLSADPKPYLNPDPETLNEQAVRVKPDLAGGWSNAASALMQLGRFREAAAKQEQALRLKPSSAAYAAALAQMERLAAGESAVPVPGQKKPEGIGWSEVGAGSLALVWAGGDELEAAVAGVVEGGVLGEGAVEQPVKGPEAGGVGGAGGAGGGSGVTTSGQGEMEMHEGFEIVDEEDDEDGWVAAPQKQTKKKKRSDGAGQDELAEEGRGELDALVEGEDYYEMYVPEDRLTES